MHTIGVTSKSHNTRATHRARAPGASGMASASCIGSSTVTHSTHTCCYCRADIRHHFSLGEEDEDEAYETLDDSEAAPLQPPATAAKGRRL